MFHAIFVSNQFPNFMVMYDKIRKSTIIKEYRYTKALN